MLLKELFAIGEDLELRNARMYAQFSLLYGEDERIADVWEQMSTDEWQHYILLNFCRGICEGAGCLEKEAPKINDIGLAETQQILTNKEKKMHNGQLSLQECFEAAILLEKGETDNIFHQLVEVSKEIAERSENVQALNKIKKAEKKADNHTERLLSAVKRFANSPELVRKAQKKLGNY